MVKLIEDSSKINSLLVTIHLFNEKLSELGTNVQLKFSYQTEGSDSYYLKFELDLPENEYIYAGDIEAEFNYSVEFTNLFRDFFSKYDCDIIILSETTRGMIIKLDMPKINKKTL